MKINKFQKNDNFSLEISSVFFLIGIILIIFSSINALINLNNLNIKTFSALFGAGAFSLILSNLSKFQRIKGFGFEAELWNDKQEEAEIIISSLKIMISEAYSQIIISKVKEGTYNPFNRWNDIINLKNEYYRSLQEIGVTDPLRKAEEEVDNFAIWHLARAALRKIQNSIDDAKRDYSGNADHSQFPKINYNLDLLSSAELRRASEILSDEWVIIKASCQNIDAKLPNENEISSYIEEISALERSRPIRYNNAVLSMLDSVDV